MLSVVRSIASEHKARMPPRSAAIIRRRTEAVTAGALGYPPQPTKAVLSPAADARNGCDQTISTPSTGLLPCRIIWLMFTNVQGLPLRCRARCDDRPAEMGVVVPSQ